MFSRTRTCFIVTNFFELVFHIQNFKGLIASIKYFEESFYKIIVPTYEFR